MKNKELGNGEPTGITSRQRKFIKAVVQGNTYRAAAIKAGYQSPDYGSILMKQPHIRTALQAYMHKAGITDELIARKLKEGLNAKTVPRSEGGKRYDDQFVRKQFLDIVLRIRGDYAPEKFEAVNKQITLVIDNKMLEALKDSKALTEADVVELERLPLNEEHDVKALDSESNQTPRSPEEVAGREERGEDTCGATRGSE